LILIVTFRFQHTTAKADVGATENFSFEVLGNDESGTDSEDRGQKSAVRDQISDF